MEQTCTACKVCVNTKLGSHDPCKVCDLDRVVENVLAVRCSVSQTADKAYKLVIDTVNIGLEDSPFALLLDAVLDLTLCLVHHFLDPCGVDTSVGNKLFKGDSCNLTSCGVEAGKCDSLGSIVDNELNSRKCLESTDISSLTSDNSSLHFIAGERNNGHCGLCDLICGTFGDCKGDKVSRLVLALVLKLLLVLLNFEGFFVNKLIFKH